MTRRVARRAVACLFVTVWLATAGWQVVKPMPPGTDIDSGVMTLAAGDIEFLHDLSWSDAAGRPAAEQRIFDAVFEIVDQAERFLVLDFFLVNDAMGNGGKVHRALSRELADRVLARKRARPALQVLLVTDPINDVYGGAPSPLLAELSAQGIEVVRTSLGALRDSNPAYSSLWRLFIQWCGNSPGTAWLPNPFDSGVSRVSLRSWLALANFKANHRKLVVADRADGAWWAVVTSANPHDASSRHSNVGLRVRGELAAVLLASELDVARFSGWTGELDAGRRRGAAALTGERVEACIVSEEAILRQLLAAIDAAGDGDRLMMAMFYLADRGIVDALVAAAARGVDVRLVLDPNKDAFGLKKDGVPNRPVARELIARSDGRIRVRWYRTHGEQFHSKLTLVTQGDRLVASLGSANLTRRNIRNYNLETNVQLTLPRHSAPARKMEAWFERIWHGDAANGVQYTAPFDSFRDDSRLRYWRYRLMEATGLSTF
jgi:phosphatidylserine/phosphatidylglycerophosphate/cardiolipin synthase-like enzyme